MDKQDDAGKVAPLTMRPDGLEQWFMFRAGRWWRFNWIANLGLLLILALYTAWLIRNQAIHWQAPGTTVMLGPVSLSAGLYNHLAYWTSYYLALVCILYFMHLCWSFITFSLPSSELLGRFTVRTAYRKLAGLSLLWIVIPACLLMLFLDMGFRLFRLQAFLNTPTLKMVLGEAARYALPAVISGGLLAWMTAVIGVRLHGYPQYVKFLRAILFVGPIVIMELLFDAYWIYISGAELILTVLEYTWLFAFLGALIHHSINAPHRFIEQLNVSSNR